MIELVTSKAILDVEIDQREVEREAQKVEQALSEVEDIEPQLDTGGMQRQLDGLDAPALDVDGPGGGLGGAGGGGVDDVGAGALSGRLASRGGLGTAGGAAAAAAIPVALAGSVGFGILRATQAVAEASPAFQQQQDMFAAAMRNFRAPFGRAIAETVMPATENLLEASVEFRKTAREEGLTTALEEITSPLLAQMTSQNPAVRAQAGGMLGAVTGGIFGGRIGAGVGGALGSVLASFGISRDLAMMAQGLDDLDRTIEDFDADVSGLFDDVRSAWPGWPAIGDRWPGWPDVGGLWPGWPSIGDLWPGWPALGDLWPGWPDLSFPGWKEFVDPINWGRLISADLDIDIDRSGIDIESEPTSDDILSPSDVGGIETTDTTGFPDFEPDLTVQGTGEGSETLGFQHGGIVTGPRQGVVGEAGPEAVLPMDTFFTSLESAIDNAMGGKSDRRDGEIIRRLSAIERILKTQDTTVIIGDRPVAAAAKRGSRKFFDDREVLK